MGSQRIHEIIHLKPLELEPDDDVLQKLYMWVDEIPLSRPKKNLARDFSDGVMIAELVKHFIPKLIDLHNFTAANSSNQKESNWFHLNKKVFSRLKFEISPEVIRAIAQCRHWVAENFLMVLREMIDVYLAKTQMFSLPAEQEDLDAVALLDQPEVDQHNRGIRQREKQLKKLTHNEQSTQDSSYNPSWQNQTVPRGAKNSYVEMVPKHYLEDKERELEIKSQSVEMLNAKVKKLEHLLTLKDMRIEDLSTKIDEQNKRRPYRAPPNQMKKK